MGGSLGALAIRTRRQQTDNKIPGRPERMGKDWNGLSSIKAAILRSVTYSDRFHGPIPGLQFSKR
jgi:hypothetical protein